MSSSTIMDSFDAPMLDYSGDMDVHMHTTVSTPKPWSQPETIMEEDAHPTYLPNPFPSHLPQQDVEIDMDDYYNENVEYEMADGEIAVPDTELVDIDVYDAPREEVFTASAPISHSTGLTNQDLTRKSVGDYRSPSDSGVATDHISAVPNLETPIRQSAEPELLTPAFPQVTAVQGRDLKSSDQSSASAASQARTPPLEAVSKDPRPGGETSAALEGQADSPAIAIADGTSNNVDIFQPLDDSEPKKGLEASTAEREQSAFVLRTVTPAPAIEESSHRVEVLDGEPHKGMRVHDENYEGHVPEAVLDKTEAGDPERPAGLHETEEEANADPHEISEGVYIEPPPPVLLELPSSSGQPMCTLFSALHLDDTEVNASSTEPPYLVLLQNRPTLYYETLNDAFDALREEECIQSMTGFVDGEIVIDAYDLQLVVAEDNVHAREVSMHDLNVLHHGLGLVGPLRLRLRTVQSRFIHRYRDLQGQVTRLNVARSASHPAEDSNEDERVYVGPPHESDSGYRHDDGQTKRELTSDDHGGLTEEGVDEGEDVESTDYDPAEYQDEHEEEAYDESEQFADAREYPRAHEDEVGAREETDQFVANDEPKSVPDADPAHKGAADPESTEHQEHGEHEEDGVSGDVDDPSTMMAATQAKENVSRGAELDVLTEVRESVATGESQPEESEERQALSTELSSPGSIYGDEQTEADELAEHAEAEDDITGEESAQSADSENNLAVVTNAEEQGPASPDNTGEYGVQEAELATPAISLRGEFSEPANPYHHTEEDEENVESWELDDGYVWEEAVDGDEFDVALVGEPDSVSTGSSTLSGNTASIMSKRSFHEIEESEPLVEQSSLQSPKKTRTR